MLEEQQMNWLHEIEVVLFDLDGTLYQDGTFINDIWNCCLKREITQQVWKKCWKKWIVYSKAAHKQYRRLVPSKHGHVVTGNA